MIFLKAALKKIFQNSLKEPIKVVFWDGEEVEYGEGKPKYTVKFNSSISSELLSEDPTLALAEAYINGDIDIEGSIEELILSLYRTENSFIKIKSKLLSDHVKLKNNKIDSRENAHYHYDIGNDFYKLWLDDSMTYSCAYFKNESDSLEDAQKNKVEHILKKLNLKRGQKLLDIGCGWGELIMKAAEEYGVKAYGITLSDEQFRGTKDTIEKQGLSGEVFVKLIDYRDLKNEKFDRIVSIGMLEHVGKGNLKDYFSKVDELLNEGGISLTHSITMPNEGANNVFLNKYIFPGGYVPGIKEIINEVAEKEFQLIDVESLRRHYAKTLEMRYKNFQLNLEKIKKIKDEKFIRMWRLFLEGCAGSFKAGNIDIHQVLFTKGINDNIPWTRDYMYK